VSGRFIRPRSTKFVTDLDRYIMEARGFYRSTMSAEDILALRSIHLRLYKCFDVVWSCVKPTLCNDAPEGYFPDELDDEDDIETKDVLSYSWRALREARYVLPSYTLHNSTDDYSLLMRCIVKNCPLSETGNALMDTEQLRNMGDLSFTQLAELRHRGAFSTVAQTFATCCLRSNNGPEATRRNVKEWYQVSLGISHLCAKPDLSFSKHCSVFKTRQPSTLAGLPAFLRLWSVSFSQMKKRVMMKKEAIFMPEQCMTLLLSRPNLWMQMQNKLVVYLKYTLLIA